MRPHRRKPTRLPRPWDSPSKNTGVGCHFLFQCMKVKSESEVTQLCPTPSDHMDCSPPGPSVHGIFQARVRDWSAINRTVGDRILVNLIRRLSFCSLVMSSVPKIASHLSDLFLGWRLLSLLALQLPLWMYCWQNFPEILVLAEWDFHKIFAQLKFSFYLNIALWFLIKVYFTYIHFIFNKIFRR